MLAGSWSTEETYTSPLGSRCGCRWQSVYRDESSGATRLAPGGSISAIRWFIPLIKVIDGRRLNDFLGLSLNDRTILFLVILLDKTVSVG